MAGIELAEFDSETTCSICYAEFLEPEDLAVHITQMHTVKIRPTLKSCHFCTETLSSLEDYASHLLKEHMQILKCCKYCTRVFDVYEDYRNHENKHYTYTAKSIYSCSQCKKLFNNISELERHETKEHFDAAEGVFINDCLPLLSSLLNIKALKFLQSLGEEVVYVCAMCEEATPDPNEYLNHLKNKKCQSLVCDSCTSVYKNKKSLIRHVETHLECNAGNKNMYKQCLECFKMFDIRMWRDHTKHCKAIKCKTCNIVFGSMYDLSKHQTTEHPSIVTLQACKFCQREFAGSICLQKHIERAHKHDAHLYKYICTCCNAIFKHPKRLFAHFYSTHKDLEPYTCKICDKKFKIRKKFTIHIKLDHKSIGYIEFDENYHVYFSDKKSDRPVTEVKSENMKSEQTTEDTEVDESGQSTKKVTFDIEEKLDDTLGKVNSDFMSATETEGNVTEIDVEEKKPKRKIKPLEGRAKKRVKKTNEVIVCDSTDEDEPLIEIRKRVKKNKKYRRVVWNRKKNSNTNEIKNPKQRFICNICSKNCYTFQNYHNHVALHYKNVVLKCVKCSESFNSQEDLNEHYSNVHASSQLTQTLKNLLEKRKTGVQNNSDLTLTERFQRTVKKVPIPNDNITVTLKEVTNKLSVQKFIESFTPEEAPKKKGVKIDCSITMKPYSGPHKESFINMKKCNLSHMDFSKCKLSMPVRFRQVLGETHKVTVKEVQFDETLNVDDKNLSYENETYYEDDNFDRNESIPEVAQEVMLEGTEEPTPKTLYIPHRIVLPKLPKEYKKVRIAHLQAEAPFYKIVKIEDVLNNSQGQDEKKVVQPENPIEKNIKLPDGTKLVTVNPLAHLLGDTPVEKILEKSKNKYHQPKAKDFEMAIAKAMLRLEKPEAFPKKKRKKTDVN